MNAVELFVPVVLGTARVGRESEKVARYVYGEIEKTGVTTELVDVRDHLIDHTIPSWEESAVATAWRDIAARADGFVIVAPEYNRSYPGELKLLLDRAYDEYVRKPVGLVGVSKGPTGGSRMMQTLKAALVPFQLVPMRNEVYFPDVAELFDEDGVIRDASNEKMVAGLMEELSWYARVLKPAREAMAHGADE